MSDFLRLPVDCPHRSLDSLTPDATRFTVRGLIIAKDSPRLVNTRQGRQSSVLTITLRDSPSAYCQVSIWGDDGHVRTVSRDHARLGSVVDIVNASVRPPQNPAYRVSGGLPFSLSVSENRGSVVCCRLIDPSEVTAFERLRRQLLRPASEHVTLGQALRCATDQPQYASLLALIQRVHPPRQLTTREGRDTCRAQLILCDATCRSFPLTFWGPENCEAAAALRPGQVVSVVDCRVSSAGRFRSDAAEGTVDKRTVLIIDPLCSEAAALLSQAADLLETGGDLGAAAATANNEEIDEDVTDDVTEHAGHGAQRHLLHQQQVAPPLHAIHTVLTAFKLSSCPPPGVEYAIAFACLTELNIGSAESPPISLRCTVCAGRAAEPEAAAGGRQAGCQNTGCAGAAMPPTEVASVTLEAADHTGTFHMRAQGQVLLQLCGLGSLDQLRSASQAHLSRVRSRLLFTRLKFYVRVVRATHLQPRPCMQLLACQPVDTQELAQCLRLSAL
ncbi:hypothetical protein BOX15_Mlig025141g1 [Macrostomum lignano]|uniref:MEIOB-like N-terminal domain-containing protein n=1 Tax=Macrostomum lignano TaxID=282301 RepID=A0A267H719_9PLAT|nr:hypothetical protein BOX15_Mlig025141g1 [Macrostomum lignano]